MDVVQFDKNKTVIHYSSSQGKHPLDNRRREEFPAVFIIGEIILHHFTTLSMIAK